jgi:hypothetical protein
MMTTLEPLAFLENNTDTHPPPATAFWEFRYCPDILGTNARTLFDVMVQSLMVTLNMANAAIAPPHDEQGSAASLGQPTKPPSAELPVKLLLRTWRKRSLPGPVTDMAPPLAAVQLLKLQCDTTRLLPLETTAPPFEFRLEQL